GLRDSARDVVSRRPDRALLRRAGCAADEAARLLRTGVRLALAEGAPGRRARPPPSPLAVARLRVVAPPVSRQGRGWRPGCLRPVTAFLLFRTLLPSQRGTCLA